MRRFTPQREWYIPKTGCKVEHKQHLGVVYTYTTNVRGRQRLAAKAFIGKQAKPAWDYIFADEAARVARIASFFKGLEASRDAKASRRAAASEPHTVKPGAIVYNSWGYDQTNVDWYVVVAASRNFVTLREIAKHYTETGFMSGDSAPSIDVSNPDPAKWGCTFASDEVRRHRVTAGFDGRASINFKHGAGSVWDGRRVYESHYA